jgi:hypothetical protein
MHIDANLHGGDPWPPDLVDVRWFLAPYPPDVIDVGGCQALYLFMARIEDLDHGGESAGVEDFGDG